MVMYKISSGVLISHVALQLMTNTEEDQARPISSLAIHCLSQVKMSQVHLLNPFMISSFSLLTQKHRQVFLLSQHISWLVSH